MLSPYQKGALLIALSGLGFSFFATLTRLIYNASNLVPTDIGVWRFILACSLLWGIILFRNRGKNIKPPIPIKHLFILGFLYAGAALTAFIGLQYINGSLYVVLFYTYPAMVALFSLMLGIPLSRTGWVALGLTIIGVVLTIPDFSLLQGGNLIGVLLAFVNALFVAIYYMASERLMRDVSDMSQGTVWMMSATLIVIIFAVPFFGFHVPSNLETWGLLAVLAIVATVIPIFSLNAGLQYIPAAQASIISSIEPLFAMVLGLVVLGEEILPLQWVGAIVIISAVILLQSAPKAKISPAFGSES